MDVWCILKNHFPWFSYIFDQIIHPCFYVMSNFHVGLTLKTARFAVSKAQ